MVNYPVKPSDSAKCNSLIMTQLKQTLSAVVGAGGEVWRSGGVVVEVRGREGAVHELQNISSGN